MCVAESSSRQRVIASCWCARKLEGLLKVSCLFVLYSTAFSMQKFYRLSFTESTFEISCSCFFLFWNGTIGKSESQKFLNKIKWTLVFYDDHARYSCMSWDSLMWKLVVATVWQEKYEFKIYICETCIIFSKTLISSNFGFLKHFVINVWEYYQTDSLFCCFVIFGNHDLRFLVFVCCVDFVMSKYLVALFSVFHVVYLFICSFIYSFIHLFVL